LVSGFGGDQAFDLIGEKRLLRKTAQADVHLCNWYPVPALRSRKLSELPASASQARSSKSIRAASAVTASITVTRCAARFVV